MGLQQLLKKWGNRNKGLNSTSTTKKRVIEIIQLNLAINTHLKGFHTFLLKKGLSTHGKIIIILLENRGRMITQILPLL